MRKFIITITQKIGIYSIIVKILTRRRNKKQALCFKKYGKEALEKLTIISDEIGKPIFLMFGTLLGAIREHNFIPHDIDLDVGMMSADRPDNMIEIFEKHGFSYHSNAYFKSNQALTEEAFDYKGVRADVFYCFLQGSDLACYSFVAHEKLARDAANAADGFPTREHLFTYEGLEKEDFLGLNVWMAKNAGKWSEERYGKSYMTPIQDWNEKNYQIRLKPHNERVYREFC